MVRALENVVYEERLRELGLFSPDTQQGPHSSLMTFVSKLLRRWSQAEVHVRRRRVNVHKLKQISPDRRGKKIQCEIAKARETSGPPALRLSSLNWRKP